MEDKNENKIDKNKLKLDLYIQSIHLFNSIIDDNYKPINFSADEYDISRSLNTLPIVYNLNPIVFLSYYAENSLYVINQSYGDSKKSKTINLRTLKNENEYRKVKRVYQKYNRKNIYLKHYNDFNNFIIRYIYLVFENELTFLSQKEQDNYEKTLIDNFIMVDDNENFEKSKQEYLKKRPNHNDLLYHAIKYIGLNQIDCHYLLQSDDVFDIFKNLSDEQIRSMQFPYFNQQIIKYDLPKNTKKIYENVYHILKSYPERYIINNEFK